MKKLTIVLVISVFAIGFASAQKLKASQVPGPAIQAFEKNYPGTKGSWEKEDGDYEVNFRSAGKVMSAVITKEGVTRETETVISVEDLPPVISQYLKKHYPGSGPKGASKVLKSNGEINFEAEMGKKDIIFDENGNFIKESKD